ncbi:MAG: hypothetical protein HKN45_10315 [Flavobacteriales bacterium]|nr:hypothetical protein [Flavobacteriales bacterium]
MKKSHLQIVPILIGILLSGCIAQMEVFDQQSDQSEIPHIGNFYATTVYEDHMSDEVWVSPLPSCITLKTQSEKVYSGDKALHVVWDKGAAACDWIGIGFGWDGWSGKNLGYIYDRSAIRFRMRTDGKPLNSLPVAMGLECYDGTSAWVGFNRKMIQGDQIGQEWTDVIIPILAFNWGEMDADITNIKQLQIEFQASGNLYIDNVEIIEYDKSLRSRGNIVARDEFTDSDILSNAPAIKENPFVIEDNEVYLSMDSTSIYVLADIIDDTPVQNSKSGDEIWNGDAVEVAFSTDYEAPLGRNFYMTTDKHFGIKIGENPIVWDWRKEKELENCTIEISKTDNGYSLMAKIPLEQLGVEEDFEHREIYGLEIAVDKGTYDSRTKQLRWNNPDIDGFHDNPSLWGEARIIKDQL